MKYSRKKIAYINSIITLIGQLAQIIIGFVVRKIFINSLGVYYLGYNSVFNNILQMLNLAELGIGVAITSFLFKPLAEGDKKRISALMYFYKKIYNFMGIIVLIIGLIISIPIGVLVPDAQCGLGYLRVLFFINLIGTVSTYFVAYKRTLIIADQRSYIANFVDTILYFIISVLQIGVLLKTPNYIIYLILQVAKNIISNIILSIKCDKEYGKMDSDVNSELINEYKPQIVQYVKEVFVSKIGATIFYSTDNIIISIFRGSVLAGYLSNYTMITTQLSAVVNQILASLQATFGNYVHSGKSIEDQSKMTDIYFCANYCIGNFCFLCFSLLVQPFVESFFGANLILPYSTAVWLGINLMLAILIQIPSQVFVIHKLFRYDRPIIITSAILNIIISACLVRKLGVNGVLIGTFVTSLIYLFSRFYIIAKHVYSIPYSYYVVKIIKYFVVSAISFFCIYFVCRTIQGKSFFVFIMRMVLVAGGAILLPAFLLSFSKEFRHLVEKMLPEKLLRYLKKGKLGLMCCGILVLSGVAGSYIEKSNAIDPLNKSYSRNISYLKEPYRREKIFNLTFDDTIECFEDITSNEYDSVFENSTLNWIKSLHDDYGIVATCYVYYENGDFNLTQCTERYRKEFEQNSNWLRFGFHTLNGQTSYENAKSELVEDYSKTIVELERIVGEKSIDNVIRLQKFQGSYQGIEKLVKLPTQPICGLLTADDSRRSYYLDENDNKYIYSHDRLYKDGICFISTDLRMEYVQDVEKKIAEFSTGAWNNQIADLVIFSHEWALSLEVKEKIEKMCQYALGNDYRFLFLEDSLEMS